MNRFLQKKGWWTGLFALVGKMYRKEVYLLFYFRINGYYKAVAATIQNDVKPFLLKVPAVSDYPC
jgi:hypothetical protein